MPRHCFALDLVDDPNLIAEYEAYHRNGWPEIKTSIIKAGVTNMEIYRTGTRLFMIMEVTGDFDFDRKEIMDAQNPKVREWEKLMWKYQQAIPWAKPGEKWVLMNNIYSLNNFI
ncbi:L-rhamnose mutarotase [Pedobacter frigidisoli]|uniref:L-rhamnose mutarotase n=1 Tax=Pedobacter frigidisoli TaxID=2530455 RepID=UPI00292EACA2|nr:L-rhamnose mutarotase [Pedobacter frigidisoli]